MAGIVLPPGFDSLCNCAYTSTSGVKVQMDIAALLKLMESIPEIPRIFKMDIVLKPSPFLPKNTIVISEDIANALEEALKEPTNGEHSS